MLSAVIIKGNPKFIQNNPLADTYYAELARCLKVLNVRVTFDAGADYTCPPKADMYIGHSRGAGRIRCLAREDQWRFLRFGDPDAPYIHPVDREWQAKNPPGGDTPPPPEHYWVTPEQHAAIKQLVARLKNGTANEARPRPTN